MNRTVIVGAVLLIVAASAWATGTTETSAAADGPKVVTTVRSSAQDIKWFGEEDWDDNAIYDAYLEDTGYDLQNLWVVDGSQYDERLKLMVASGELPDFFHVPNSANLFGQLVEADLLRDMSDVFEAHASDALKEWMYVDGGVQMASGTIGGELLGIPETGAAIDQLNVLYVRKDWLDALGIDEPRTMQDVFTISRAFTEQDPDGNGNDDTYGLAFTQKFLTDAVYTLVGYFNGFHAYPRWWIEDEGGSLVYGSVQPEMRQALRELQRMYRNGEIDPEFGVKDAQRVNELAVNDQLGMTYGKWWMPAWPLNAAAVQDGAHVQDWRPFLLPSIDDTPASTQVTIGVSGYYVVTKEAQYPEAVIAFMNKWVEHELAGPTDPVRIRYQYGDSWGKDEGQNYWKLSPVRLYYQTANLTQFLEGVRLKDRTLVENNALWATIYDRLQAWEAGDVGQWQTHIIWDLDGTQQMKMEMVADGRVVYNEFYGSPTETMVSRMATLEAREEEVFTRIILDESPIEAFDEFVDEWHDLGGTAITEEVNQWYDARR